MKEGVNCCRSVRGSVRSLQPHCGLAERALVCVWGLPLLLNALCCVVPGTRTVEEHPRGGVQTPGLPCLCYLLLQYQNRYIPLWGHTASYLPPAGCCAWICWQAMPSGRCCSVVRTDIETVRIVYTNNRCKHGVCVSLTHHLFIGARKKWGRGWDKAWCFCRVVKRRSVLAHWLSHFTYPYL